MTFVVTAGQLRGVERAPVPPVYAMSVGTDDRIRDYATLWRVQPELRTVVDFLARNISQLGLHVFRRVDDADRVRLFDHPLSTLLDQPNPQTTRYRLINALVHDRCIYDSAYWLKTRGEDGQTIGLRRIRPNRILPLGMDWLEPDEYMIFGTLGRITVPRDAVVHFRGYNPFDERLGSPPIEALRQVLSEEWAANVYRQQLWRNGARMNGYIKRPVDAPDWGSKGRGRFRDEWNAQYTGDSASAGSVAILEDGMDFIPAATTPRDAQYVESRKLTREEVARSFHVPLPMVGILDHATFSNIREQHKQLYQDCLGPWLEDIQQDIELQLLPDLPDASNVYVEFNINEKLRGSFEEQAIQLQSSVGGPYMTRNEARARLNLPAVPGGDDLIVPLNVTAGEAQPEPEASDESGGQAAGRAQAKAVFARFFRRQGQAVASRTGAARSVLRTAKTSDVFDAERWNAELVAELVRWLPENPAGIAADINARTAAEIADALRATNDPVTAVVGLFDAYADGRAEQLAELVA